MFPRKKSSAHHHLVDGHHHDHHGPGPDHHSHSHSHSQSHSHSHGDGGVSPHLLAQLGWGALGNRNIHRLGRRRFVADLGKGTFAVAILGVAGCASDATTNTASAPDPTTVPDSDAPDADASESDAPEPTETPASPTEPDPTVAAESAATPDEAGADLLTWEHVPLGFVSAYVLLRGNRAAIADSGIPGSVRAIGTTLRRLGATYDDVDHIVLTHAHGDHVGGLPELVELAGSATVYAGEADIPNITSPVALQAVGDGDDVFGLEVFETPGHTPGSISLLDPGIGLLIAGDAVVTNDAGTEVQRAAERFSDDMNLVDESVRKLAELAPDALAIGHGAPIESGAAALLDELAASL